MRPDTIAFTIAGICFGVLLGWVLGSQRVAQVAPAPAPAQTQAPAQARPSLDEAKVQQLTTILSSDPKNVTAAIQLGNTYFDAEKYDDAIKWYEQAVKLDPANPDASTDLGVSYYYTNRPDHALEQFEKSLKIDPNHTKTLLNKGIVLAFGKNDLKGASAAWQKVVDISPNTPEAQAAQRGLEGIAAASKRAGSAGAPANP